MRRWRMWAAWKTPMLEASASVMLFVGGLAAAVVLAFIVMACISLAMAAAPVIAGLLNRW